MYVYIIYLGEPLRRSKDDAELTKNEILKSALKVFYELGYGNTRLVDVASAAGVTRGAIYHYFENKEDPFRSLADKFSAKDEETLERITNQLAKEGSVEVIGGFMVEMFERFETDSKVEMIDKIMIRAELAGEIQFMKDHFLAKMDKAMSDIENVIISQQKKGNISTDINARTLTIGFVSFYFGVTTFWMMYPNLFSIKKNAKALMEIFTRGLDS